CAVVGPVRGGGGGGGGRWPAPPRGMGGRSRRPRLWFPWPPPPSIVSLPAPPLMTLFRMLPVILSPRDPPRTFSIVLPADRVRVSPALTACAAGLARLTATAR